MSPSRLREACLQVRRALPVSERRTCRVLGQHRSTQRHPPGDDADEQRLTADIVALARDYGRYGYRRIHALLGNAGWQVSLSVVERIWRRECLKVPKRQPKRRRLWLGDGSCIRLRDELLNGEIFYSLEEVRIVTGWWRDHYNRARPHSSLGYRPPVPETIKVLT